MKRPLSAAALGLALILMAWLAWWREIPDPTAKWEGHQLCLTGQVYHAESRGSLGKDQMWIYLKNIGLLSEAQNKDQKTNQKISVSTSGADIFSRMICITETEKRPLIGSRICVTGHVESISHATNPGEFDYAVYYDSIGIDAFLKDAQIQQISQEYSPLREALYQLRSRWKKRLYEVYPPSEASVLTAMLLGDKVELDDEIRALYQQNGIIHILSISGLHITLLGMSVYELLRKGGCPVWAAALAGAVLLVCYGLLTGMGLSAVRAISMYLVRMLAQILGRTYDMLTALGLSAILMLCSRPAYLNHSGFLLSFGSICGLGVLLPAFAGQEPNGLRRKLWIWKRNGSRWPELLQILLGRVGAAMLPGISITLFTLPMQLKLFYKIPLYSVGINLLVVPLVSIVMLSGIAVMIIPWCTRLRILAILILNWYESLCEWCGELPFQSWNPGAPDAWQIAVYYGLLAVFLYFRQHGVGKHKQKQANQQEQTKWQRRIRLSIGRSIFLLLPAAVLVIGIRIPQPLTVTFLDVGQGDCIVVETAQETYLFDCGSSSRQKVYEDVLLPFLQYRGIRQLDGVFVSHADWDHISGILELLRTAAAAEEDAVRIRRLVLPAIEDQERTAEFAELQEAAGKIPVVYMGSGTIWQSGEVIFRCLHPESGSRIDGSNAYSQCFLIQYSMFRMLLTGDIEGEGEEKLLRRLQKEEIRQISLLKVAHHGSAYSTPEILLEQLEPMVSVISCGRKNRYGHPHEELLGRLKEAGSRIRVTAEDGAVTVRVRHGKMKVSGFLQ